MKFKQTVTLEFKNSSLIYYNKNVYVLYVRMGVWRECLCMWVNETKKNV